MRSFKTMAADHHHNLLGAIALFLDDDTAQDLKPLLDARDFLVRGFEPFNQPLIDGMRAKGFRIHSITDTVCFLPMISRNVLQTYIGKLQDLLPKWKNIVDKITNQGEMPTAADMKKVVELGLLDFMDDIFDVAMTNLTCIYETFEVPEDQRPPRAVIQMMLTGVLPLTIEFLFKLFLRNADLVELYVTLVEKHFGPIGEELEDLPVEDAA
jgi:hypothetical protein